MSRWSVSVRPTNLVADRRGSTAVEFAFIAPAFFALLFGLFQFGWAMHCSSSVRYALEQASRSVMLNPAITQTQVQTAVRSRLQAIADPTNVTVTLAQETPSPGVTLVRATSHYQHVVSAPFLGDYTLNYTHSISVIPNA